MVLNKGVSVEITNYIVFFKGLKSMEINIGFSDIQSVTNFQSQLNDTWLDFMFVHTFTMNDTCH
jgi:hypothetical protein